jgi:hypothetical protein
VSSGTWVAVIAAALVASAVAGALFTLPVWTRSRRPRAVAMLLTLQGGGALVVGAIVASAAVRSWHLLDEPASKHVAPTLMSVSRIDGDGSMFALVLITVVAAAVLSAIVLFLSARFAAGDVPAERTVACIVLGLEIGICGYGLAALLGGTHGAAPVLAVVNLPLAMAAMVACWPPRAAGLP